MSGVRRRWFPLADEEAVHLVPRASATAPAAAARGPVDPLQGPKLALAGRVVTMDDRFDVIDDGVLWMDKGVIVAVHERNAPAPEGFDGVRPVATRGTLFPGLIELHNHLSYNVLPLWSPVPRRFEHRGQWPDHADYRRLVSGPMTVIGRYRDAQGRAALLAPLVRYVECKCLLGGVTTSQGIMLNSNAGVQRFYRGILRNVENTDDEALPEAQGRIADVDARDARKFLARLRKEDSCLLLHLSEGVTADGNADSPARRHFLALQVAPDEWAINDKLSAIHSAGLLPEDFDVLAAHGGAMVWSPLSNLLLYGATARVDAARRAGVRIGIGSDWSPSGSKNLLGELKVAWLYSRHLLDGLFSARDLVAMATRDAAAILKWRGALGTLEAGTRADVIAIEGTTGDPYEQLIRAKETSIRLVMINGVARYGTPALVRRFVAGIGTGDGATDGGATEHDAADEGATDEGATADGRASAKRGEMLRVGGRERVLFLDHASGDPDVASLSLRAATGTLRRALRDLRKLAREMERPRPAMRAALDAAQPVVWSLALDEIQASGIEQRPRLPFGGPDDFTGPQLFPLRVAAAPLSEILEPIALDPLTVCDDAAYLARIAAQPNVPAAIRDGLASLY